MHKFILTAILAVFLGSLFTVYAQNGFVVWAEGGGCDRELKFNKLTNGTLGEKQLAVKKGIGADIHVHISYDGVWIAFSRATKTWKTSMGGCDYHSSGNFDMYIAKIDNGKNLPAEAIKIDHGYWSSWGDDAKDPNKPKTLYYSKGKGIMKTIVQPDGSFSTPEKHCDVPGGMQHCQASPDGKFVLHRPGKIKLYSIAAKKDISGDLGGCHPAWGPRSKYFIRAQFEVFYNTGSGVKKLGQSGLGKYWAGFSNDAFYDEGKLWVIGKMGGGEQNAAGPVAIREIDISGGGWKAGKEIKVGQGNASDIHVYGPDGPPTGNRNKARMNKIDNGLTFNAKVHTGANGLQLIINSQILAGYTAGLYDMQGKQVAFIRTSGSSQNIIPLNNISDGKYLLKLTNNGVNTQQAILISR